MAGQKITIRNLAAMCCGCRPDELIKFREEPGNRQVVVIAPTGQKFKYSYEELEQIEQGKDEGGRMKDEMEVGEQENKEEEEKIEAAAASPEKKIRKSRQRISGAKDQRLMDHTGKKR